MKKIVFLFFIVFMHLKTDAQFGSVFAPNKTQWVQQQGYEYTTGPGVGPLYKIWYGGSIIIGDTLVDNKHLQKLYNNSGNYIDTMCNNFVQYLYTDSNRVYYGNDANSLTLAYDFNLMKGDSFPINGMDVDCPNTFFPKTYYPKVDSVTYISYAGKMRKWIRFTTLPHNTNITWVQGVGDIKYGLVLNQYSNIMIFNCFDGGWFECSLNCYIDGDSGNYCTVSNCTQSGIEQYSNNKQIKIYPNPVNGILNVECPTPNENIEITDVLGKVVIKQSSLNTKQYVLDLSELNNGVYFIKAGNQTQKLIKN
ncbi:MAG: T9SS type A sorting domain-containing protein [Bacteroidia bacterium]